METWQTILGWTALAVVYAAGVLVGGDDSGAICIYHDISRVLRMTNASLYVAPPES